MITTQTLWETVTHFDGSVALHLLKYVGPPKGDLTPGATCPKDSSAFPTQAAWNAAWAAATAGECRRRAGAASR